MEPGDIDVIEDDERRLKAEDLGQIATMKWLDLH